MEVQYEATAVETRSGARRAARPVALVTTGVVTPTAASAHPVPAWTSSPGTVLQTNLVSDLPGVAATTDPNLVNAWGISESSGSPFWISDNNAGLTTLYNVLEPARQSLSTRWL